MADFIEWHGGPCPVAAGVLVDIRHRDGHEQQRLIEYAGDWRHLGTPCDIVAYRILRDAQEQTP